MQGLFIDTNKISEEILLSLRAKKSALNFTLTKRVLTKNVHKLVFFSRTKQSYHLHITRTSSQSHFFVCTVNNFSLKSFVCRVLRQNN